MNKLEEVRVTSSGKTEAETETGELVLDDEDSDDDVIQFKDKIQADNWFKIHLNDLS